MSWTPVATVDELTEGIPLAVTVDDSNLAIVKIADEIFAVEDWCSHGHVPLSDGDVDPDECTIECYLHSAQFDLRTGRACSLPATQPICVYPCRIDGDTVVVDIHHPQTQEK